MRTIVLGCAAAIVAVPAVHAADLAQRLQHDPFAVKPWPLRSATAVAPGAAAAAESHPELRAVLAAGAESRVLLGSQLLRIGEFGGDYRLLQVRERSAVFEHGGRHVEIGLRSTVLP